MAMKFVEFNFPLNVFRCIHCEKQDELTTENITEICETGKNIKNDYPDADITARTGGYHDSVTFVNIYSETLKKLSETERNAVKQKYFNICKTSKCYKEI